MVRAITFVDFCRRDMVLAGVLRDWLKTPPSDNVTSCFWARTGCTQTHKPRNKKMLEDKRAAVVRQNCLIVVLIEQVGRRTRDRRPQPDRTRGETVRSQESYRIVQES
jgi:hypothetical protein